MRKVLALLLCMAPLWGQGQRRSASKRGIWGQCPGGPPISAAPRVDRQLNRLANETGGQAFNLRGADLDKMTAIMEARLKGNQGPIVLASGTLPDPAIREFHVPVDSISRSVTFSVTVELKCSINLLRPAGGPVETGPSFSITEFSSGRLVTVSPPEPGVWRVQVSGFGAFSVSAHADSDLHLDSFAFVEKGGRPGHEGLFPIRGQPVVGRAHMGQAGVSGPFRSVTFRLLSELGELLQELNLAAVDKEQFIGAVELPSEPFRVAAVGYDSTGALYQRVYPALLRQQTVEVTAAPGPDSVAAGATAVVAFVVRNLGARATFDVVIVDSAGAAQLASRRLTLATGASATVTAELLAPADAAAGSEIALTAAATSTSDPSISNGVALSLRVGSSRE
jgi:hypothetical protein